MCATESNPQAPAGPRIWALIGPKHGDNAQVRALAAALVRTAGARVEERALRYHGAELLVHLWPGPTRMGLAPGARQALRPPWPDLVIGAGRRSEPVARWIRAASRGRTRIVHLGRPWASPAAFDLVVTSSQYRLPASPRVLECVLPLTAELEPGPAAPDRAGAPPWPFADLPRPWTGVLLGGDSGFLLFDAERARHLAERLNASQAVTGGSLVVTGSPRTPAPFLDVLEAALAVPSHLHRWSSGTANPYRTILADADVLVVTSDSVSMVVEALTTGRPVYLYDVQPRGRGWWWHWREYRWRALSHRFVQACAPARLRRDIRRIHERLVSRGAVRWFEGPAAIYAAQPVDAAADLEVALGRVLEVLAEP